jgi:hypothetical protein
MHSKVERLDDLRRRRVVRLDQAGVGFDARIVERGARSR